MKRFFIAIISLLLLTGSFVSCNHTPSAVQCVDFDTLTIDSICPLFRNYEKPACHITVKMATPSAANDPEVSQAIERFLSNLPKDGAFEEEAEGSVESMVSAYVRSYITTYLKEGHDAIDSYGEENIEAAATWMSYEETVEGRVIYNEDQFLSYQFHTYSYTGGAHGNTSNDNGVLDLKNYTRLDLGCLFADISMPDLNALLRYKLARQYECEDIEALKATGLFFQPDEIEANENFYIDAKGITWVYDPYEIAPYSTGEVAVTLSWYEVYPFLLNDSPILALAHKYTDAQ